MAGASFLPYTHILLPHKEVMTDQNAGAIASIAAQNVRLSSPDQKFTVLGRQLDGPPMPDITYQPLAPGTAGYLVKILASPGLTFTI